MPNKSVDPRPSEPAQATPLKRRGWLLGAGAVGAVAIAAKTGALAPTELAAAAAASPVDADGGYRLTPHVLRYYQTAKA